MAGGGGDDGSSTAGAGAVDGDEHKDDETKKLHEDNINFA